MENVNLKKIWGTFPEFCGAFSATALPQHKGMEIAFIGRSNAGKSSLINALFNTKKLARVSQMPGCTKSLMLFKVYEGLYIVDLPGYGFNKQPKHIQKEWRTSINAYFAYRNVLTKVYVLLDARRGLTEYDKVMLAYLNHYCVPHTLILTKKDKVKRDELEIKASTFKAYLGAKSTSQYYYVTSSVTKEGLDDVRLSVEEHLRAP